MPVLPTADPAGAADVPRSPALNPSAPGDPVSRRGFALGGLLGGLGVLGLTAKTGYDALAVAPFRPELERVELPLPRGHEGLAGLRIGFVADTHVGPFTAAEDVARATALLAREAPDLLLLGGDYVSDSPRHAGPAAAVLGELARRAPLGAYAVLGNHDAGERHRDARVTTALRDAGIVVLRNEAAAVETGRGALWIAGVDEAIMATADPVRTFAAIPSGAAALALWHEPDYAEQTAALGAFAQLSGHSHGGQVRLPGVGPLMLPAGGRRYVLGLNRAAGMPVYTTRGVGVYLPPIRLNCPPEVTLVTLTAPNAAAGGR